LKNLLNYFVIPGLIISGIVTAYLPEEYKYIGIRVTIALGALSLYQHFAGISAEHNNKKIQDVFNVTLFESTGKSAYFKKIMMEFNEKNGFTRAMIRDLIHEIELNKNNFEARQLFLLSKISYLLGARSAGIEIRHVEKIVDFVLSEIKSFSKNKEADKFFVNQAYGLLYGFKGEHEKARKYIRKNAKKHPQCYLQLAESHLRSHEFQKALKYLEKAEENGVIHQGFELLYGVAYLNLGRKEEAYRLIKSLIKKKVFDTGTLRIMCIACYQNGKHWQRAYYKIRILIHRMRFGRIHHLIMDLWACLTASISALRYLLLFASFAVAKKTPILKRIFNPFFRPDRIIIKSADLSRSIGNFDVAIMEYEKAIKLSNRSDNYNNMGLCYYSIGKVSDAKKTLKKGIRIDDVYAPVISENLEAIESGSTPRGEDLEWIDPSNIIFGYKRS